jgi:hypothetical protein
MANIIIGLILFGAFAIAGYSTIKKLKSKDSCSCCSGCPSEAKCKK